MSSFLQSGDKCSRACTHWACDRKLCCRQLLCFPKAQSGGKSLSYPTQERDLLLMNHLHLLLSSSFLLQSSALRSSLCSWGIKLKYWFSLLTALPLCPVRKADFFPKLFTTSYFKYRLLRLFLLAFISHLNKSLIIYILILGCLFQSLNNEKYSEVKNCSKQRGSDMS